MRDGNMERPLLWVAIPTLGTPSQVWALRQIDRLRAFETEILTWKDCRNPGMHADLAVHLVQGPDPYRIGEQGVGKWLARLIRLPRRNFMAAMPGEVAALQRLSSPRRPSVLLSHFGFTGLRMLAVSRRLGLPHAVHFHGVDLSGALRNRWYRWSLLAQLQHFDAMVVVGSQQRDWLLKHGADPARVHLIPCGAPVRNFTRTRLSRAGSAHFITVSRLVAQKGVDVALNAFARVANEVPAAHMTIVGDGPERVALENLVTQLGIGERVQFTGDLPPERVRAALEDASIFLQHSLDHEGFGVSLTEAMAMGLPAIVSACGGLLDQVTDGETGLVCPQRDVDALSAAMVRLVRDEALANRLGTAGRASAIANFDTDRQVARLEAVLIGLIR